MSSPQPITSYEWEKVKAGNRPELEWFLLESSLVSNWFEPTEEDKAQFRYIVSLPIDTYLIRGFLSKLSRHQGRMVNKFFSQELGTRWPERGDHENLKIRNDLEQRYHKWGIKATEDCPMFDEEVWA